MRRRHAASRVLFGFRRRRRRRDGDAELMYEVTAWTGFVRLSCYVGGHGSLVGILQYRRRPPARAVHTAQHPPPRIAFIRRHRLLGCSGGCDAQLNCVRRNECLCSAVLPPATSDNAMPPRSTLYMTQAPVAAAAADRLCLEYGCPCQSPARTGTDRVRASQP